MPRIVPFVVSWSIAAAPLLAGEPQPSPGDEATLSAPVALADRLLAETGTVSEAGRVWLRRYLSNEAVDGRIAATRAAMQERFDRALDEARCAHEKTLGVFAFDAAAAGGTPWRRLGAGERPGERAVLLIHGLDEGGTIWDNLAPALRDAGHTVLSFNYPNDQQIAASADRLAVSLRDLGTRGVRRVAVVGHSMGGLVARDVLTRREYYDGDGRGGSGLPAVDRLILLGPPNHGSPLAPLRGAMEVRDQFVRWISCEDKSAAALLGFMVDGDGEAGTDLLPGSAFLTDLNSRPLPSGVAITIIAGEIAANGRDRLSAALDSAYVRRIIGAERAEQWKNGSNGAWNEVGDGAVPASSTRLEGVTDVVVVRADHRSMVRTLEPVEAVRGLFGAESPVPPAIPVVLDRLREDE